MDEEMSRKTDHKASEQRCFVLRPPVFFVCFLSHLEPCVGSPLPFTKRWQLMADKVSRRYR